MAVVEGKENFRSRPLLLSNISAIRYILWSPQKIPLSSKKKPGIEIFKKKKKKERMFIILHKMLSYERKSASFIIARYARERDSKEDHLF